MAAILDQTIDQGTSYSNTITVFQSDGTTPLDLNGYTVASQIRKNFTSSSFHTITCTIVSPTTTGKINLTLTPAQTEAIKFGYYYYDVEITSGSGTVTRVIEGKMHIKPGVTRAS